MWQFPEALQVRPDRERLTVAGRVARARSTRTRASTFVISITPFTEDGAVDEVALRGHLQRMAAAGIGVYLGGGGSGEGYVLSPDETRRLLQIGVEELRGKVPVRAMGVEPRTSVDMIEYLEMVSGIGVDAAQIYSLDQGHGHRPTQDEISPVLRRRPAGDRRLPAVLSTHQSVGYQVPVPMLVEFADRFDHLIGINVSHQDLGYLSADHRCAGRPAGDPCRRTSPGADRASRSAPPATSAQKGNLAPTLCVGVIDAYQENDAHGAWCDLYGTLLRLSARFYAAGGIRATKAALNALGLPGGYPRLPQLPVPDASVPPLLDSHRATRYRGDRGLGVAVARSGDIFRLDDRLWSSPALRLDWAPARPWRLLSRQASPDIGSELALWPPCRPTSGAGHRAGPAVRDTTPGSHRRWRGTWSCRRA